MMSKFQGVGNLGVRSIVEVRRSGLGCSGEENLLRLKGHFEFLSLILANRWISP
jgi:hypothetical protein